MDLDVGDAGCFPIIMIGGPLTLFVALLAGLVIIGIIAIVTPPIDTVAQDQVITEAGRIGLTDIDKVERCPSCCGGDKVEGYRFWGLNKEHRAIVGGACKSGDRWTVGFKFQ